MCQCITAHYPIGVQPLHKFSYFCFALLEIFTYILHGRLHVGDSVTCTIKWFVHFGIFVDVVIVLVLDDFFSSGSASNCFFQMLGESLH
jgi:hypothetical protein